MSAPLDRKAARGLVGRVKRLLEAPLNHGDFRYHAAGILETLYEHLPLALNDLDEQDARIKALAMECGEAESPDPWNAVRLWVAAAKLGLDESGMAERITALEAERDIARSWNKNWAVTADTQEERAESILADLRAAMAVLEPFIAPYGNMMPIPSTAIGKAYILLARLKAAYPELEVKP